MALKYKMYQLHTAKQKYKNYWYARVAYMGTLDTRQLAARISERCTVTESDILAVLSALVVEMTHNLQNGMRIKLDNFGTFKLSISSKGEKERKDFIPAKNIKKTRVLFQPYTRVGVDNSRFKSFVTGVQVEELTAYKGSRTKKKEGETTGGGTNPSGGQSHP